MPTSCQLERGGERGGKEGGKTERERVMIDEGKERGRQRGSEG